MIALVRAYNDGDTEGVAAILDHADLRTVTEVFLAAFHELLCTLAATAGAAGEGELREYIDGHLAEVLEAAQDD
ncbi:MAG TPA: hypothetical protein VIZ17_09150, partial [Acetobacteraceae bacterium]